MMLAHCGLALFFVGLLVAVVICLIEVMRHS
jgi:hypothetical protein